jgi:hypothetical protein
VHTGNGAEELPKGREGTSGSCCLLPGRAKERSLLPEQPLLSSARTGRLCGSRPALKDVPSEKGIHVERGCLLITETQAQVWRWCWAVENWGAPDGSPSTLGSLPVGYTHKGGPGTPQCSVGPVGSTWAASSSGVSMHGVAGVGAWETPVRVRRLWGSTGGTRVSDSTLSVSAVSS